MSRQAVGCRCAGRQRRGEERRGERRRRQSKGFSSVGLFDGEKGVVNPTQGEREREREREREGLLEGRRPLGWRRGWEGSDVLPVSIIIGG